MKLKNFKSFKELELYIRKNKTEDYFKVEGIIYSMEEYDIKGELIKYANKKHNKGFLVETTNRYGSLGFSDAHIEFNPKWDYFRNDISYYE